jgi:aminoglycoside phosphotransferase (APT) family kinase protein
MTSLDDRCRTLIAELNLGQPEEVIGVTPLTGGVASDIAKVDLPKGSICVKFALPKLKVSENWEAPVHRNAAEYAWLELASDVHPQSAVQLFGRSATQHGFAMEFISGDDVYLWKTAMLDGKLPKGEAAAVGDLLGKLHSASTTDTFDAKPFQNHDDFFALRLEPYLTFTATRHPVVADKLSALAAYLKTADRVLVHGDVSPKNILFRESGPIILDAECATMGDASFDLAFCINHLVLKAVHVPHIRAAMLNSIHEFWNAYASHITWEAASKIQERICQLLPALMLARVDGKSPVEYLSTKDQSFVRTSAILLLHDKPHTLHEFVRIIVTALQKERQ